MTEIKYRLYDKANKIMMTDDEIKSTYLLKALNDNDENELFSSFMQYTGVTDINGNEVYDRDILKVIYTTGYITNESKIGEIGIVRWNKDLLCWSMSIDSSIKHLSDVLFRKCYIKVIGNIYENPELI